MTTPVNFRVKNGLTVANGVTVTAGNVVITGGQLVIGATVINSTSVSGSADNAYTNAIAIAANASNLTSGTVAIARIPTADSVSNTSISHVPTANNVKTAYDAAIAANTNANTALTAAATAYTNAVSYTDGKILTANGAITGNAATAYTNAVSYTDTKIGTANTAMVANADAAYTNAVSYTDGKINTANSAITGNAATAYTNAIAIAANADNLASGTVNIARIPVVDAVNNTSISFVATANSVKTAYDAAITANTNANTALAAAGSAYSNAVTYTDTKIGTANTAMAANADAAYTNAIAVAANATNLTSGTVNIARIPVLDAINNTSISHVASANSVKTAYDAAITANTNANTALTAAGAAYTNAVSYTDGKILTANDAITGNAATAYTNAVSYTDTKIGTANTAMAANADAAYTNAISIAANASNLTSGTVAFARLPSLFIGTTTIQSTSAAQAVSGITTLAAGNTTITGDMTVSGNLTISGTTTNIDSTNLLVEDKNIILGDVATPSDVTADGGGITLKGATDKTFNWVDATDSWTASEHIDLAAGKVYKIGTTTIANSTALGTGILASSLTSVGTLSSLTLGGALSGVTTLAAGNTTITGFANASVSVNSALLTVGSSFIANSTGVTTTGFANVSTTLQVGTNTATFGTAVYIVANGNVGIGNTAPTNKLSVNGTTFLGGTLAAGNTTITGFANVSTRVNSAILSVGSSFIANSTGVTSTGFGKFDESATSPILRVITPGGGFCFIANNTQVTIGSNFAGEGIKLSANGGVGTAGQVLASNGSTGSPYWVSLPVPETEPTIQAVASGILGDGSAVVLNANGTVSFVGQTMGALSSGTSAEFLSTEVGSEISAVYDSSQERVVIAYKDGATGKAKVGTVSGNTISFGTAVQFSNATFNYLSATYDTAQQRVVITYSDSNAGKGKAIVGTVSNTSISFGTEAEFESACNNISYVSTVYDTAQQKTVTIYKKNNDNTSLAIVGIVSNTSISFGTAVEWANSSTSVDAPFAAYSPTSGKVVVAYRGDNVGSAIVGTVSGNSISFGTPAVFNTSYTDSISAGHDNTSGRVVIAYRGTNDRGFATVTTISGNGALANISFGTAVGFTGNNDTFSTSVVPYTNGIIVSYMDGGNSYFGTARTGTVTGKSISFGDPVVFESANSTGVDSITSAFHSAQNKIVVASRAGSGDIGRSSVLEANVGATNLTSNNFIGFSSATYANGATAVIQIAGAIDDAQSGLSSGQSYYVQPNGGLGLTANSPSVFAGTTASENRIIVKGFSSDAKIVVGLGNTSAPSYTFTGDTNTGMFSPAADTLAFSIAGTQIADITSDGVNATNFNSLSDETTKENIQKIQDATNLLDMINPVSFTWKDTGSLSYGVIAQEIEKVLPTIVATNKDSGLKSVSYNQLIPILVQAIKELKIEIEHLKNCK